MSESQAAKVIGGDGSERWSQWEVGDLTVVYAPGEQVALCRSWHGLSVGVSVGVSELETLVSVLREVGLREFAAATPEGEAEAEADE